MPSLKEIRNRITSVGSTMQITSAMKMVSAAKLKRAQDAITQMRPYAEKLQDILGNLSATLDLSENAFSEARDAKNILIVGIFLLQKCYSLLDVFFSHIINYKRSQSVTH